MRKPIIILEGNEAVGKSTLAKMLSEMFDIPVIHSTSKTANDFEYHSKILDEVNVTGGVLDRFFYGEFIYGPLFNREPKLTPSQLRTLEWKAIKFGARLIYVTCNIEEAQRRAKVRGDESIAMITHFMPRVHNRYNDFLKSISLFPDYGAFKVFDTTYGGYKSLNPIKPVSDLDTIIAEWRTYCERDNKSSE